MTVTWMTNREAKTNNSYVKFKVIIYGHCCIRVITGTSVYLETMMRIKEEGLGGACSPLPMPTML